jgi:predicted GIY-YIG superfamily endonuclease
LLDLTKDTFGQFVYRQALEKTGCPYCGFRKLLPGFNDLLSQDPIVAAEWDLEKNSTKPYQVLYGGHTKYWFKCASGHKWKANLISRKRSGCPGCAKYGFKGTEPAYLYLLRNLRLKAIKIGITNRKTSRIADFQRSGWELLATKEFEVGHEARELEKVLKKILNLNISKTGFVERSEMGRLGGFTETTEWSANLEKKLITLVRR